MRLLLGCFAAICLPALCDASESLPVALQPVTVTALRTPQIGVAEARVDSAALRESISQSMAEVLGFNSALFIKNYGRASLATASFRGTSAAHTAVTWNGMSIASPMLGTTDFSMVPAFFIDNASLVFGSSAIADTGGGLGGLVKLSTTSSAARQGFYGQYVQGIGSWRTFDEFLRLGYARGRFSIAAKVSMASSANDFPFTNHDKKENVYDDNHNIISQFHPRERNRSGAFADFNAMVSAAYDSPRAGRWSIDAWYLSSNRQLPVLTTDYSNSFRFDNRQREQTLRAVAAWQRFGPRHTLTARAGYVHSWIAYDYWRQNGADVVSVMARNRNRINSVYGQAEWRWFPSPAWFFEASAEITRHHVASHDFASMTSPAPGYAKGRTEANAAVQAKWRPSLRWGLGAVVRQEIHGSAAAAPSPAVFADAVIWPRAALTARASASRTYRFPTLNDLYTMPGGNPDLRPEKGFSYDASLSSSLPLGAAARLNLSAGWFDSRIDDWILWLPSPRGFYVPRNADRVHSYGAEASAAFETALPAGWHLQAAANYAWTASINQTNTGGSGSENYGKQMPYAPRHSASASLRVEWRRWGLAYHIQAYSERFTMTSNESTLSGRLPAYSVSNIQLDRPFSLWRLDWQAKIAVNNLFNADYQTVLSRPMPGINFEIFLSLSW